MSPSAERTGHLRWIWDPETTIATLHRDGIPVPASEFPNMPGRNGHIAVKTKRPPLGSMSTPTKCGDYIHQTLWGELQCGGRGPLPPLLSLIMRLPVPADLSETSLEWAISLLGSRQQSSPLTLYVSQHLKAQAFGLATRTVDQLGTFDICVLDGTVLDCGSEKAWAICRELDDSPWSEEDGCLAVWTPGV